MYHYVLLKFKLIIEEYYLDIIFIYKEEDDIMVNDK